MKIGEFTQQVQTTKDTVRHYESLNLLQPEWENNRRIYGKKEVEDFLVIKEMQSIGLSLHEVQALFELKRINGCSSPELIENVRKKLMEKDRKLEIEEERIRQQRQQINEIANALNALS